MRKRRWKFLEGAEGRAWLQAHPKAVDRLVKEGSRWRDPLTRQEFSARQVQKVTTGYFPEQLAVERRFQRTGAKDAGEDLERLITSYRAARSRQAGRKGLLPRADAVAKDSPFWQHVRDLRSTETGAKGRKAKALVALGLRDPKSTIRVGGSPKGEREVSDQPRSARYKRKGRRKG